MKGAYMFKVKANSETAGAKNSGEPKGAKQTSGKTKHSRMSTGAKVESSGNLPKTRCC